MYSDIYDVIIGPWSSVVRCDQSRLYAQQSEGESGWFRTLREPWLALVPPPQDRSREIEPQIRLDPAADPADPNTRTADRRRAFPESLRRDSFVRRGGPPRRRRAGPWR